MELDQLRPTRKLYSTRMHEILFVSICNTNLNLLFCFSRLPTPAAGAGDAIKDGDPPSTALQAIATAVERIKADYR